MWQSVRVLHTLSWQIVQRSVGVISDSLAVDFLSEFRQEEKYVFDFCRHIFANTIIGLTSLKWQIQNRGWAQRHPKWATRGFR